MTEDFQEKSAAPIQLPYAAHTGKYNRLILRLSVSILVLAGVLVLIRQGPLLWRRLRFLELQSRCLSHQMDPARPIATMTAEPFGVEMAKLPFNVPPEWRQLLWDLGASNLRSEGTVFLHELTSPGGHRCLVAIDLFGGAGPSAFYLASNVIVPGTLWRKPRVVNLFGASSDPIIRIAVEGVVHPAILDAGDHSHFCFVVDQGIGQLRVDGWLRDDDTIAWQVKGPEPASP